MAFCPSVFAPDPVSPEESGRNLWRNKLTQVGTLPTTKTEKLSVATSKNNNSLTEDRECMDNIRVKHARKLTEAKHVLKIKARENVVEALHMIDVIQMLGIECHFEEEIEEALQKLQLIFTSRPSDRGLHEVALQFRLLRQGGYIVPADVFNKFKDEKGKIKQKFSEDIMGLIELYEASQLSVEGEDSLDEAGDMSHRLLDAYGYHNITAIVLVKSNYSNYFQSHVNEGWTSTLQELAQVDSSVVKSIHQQEILQAFRWWNDLGLAKELQLVRDEPLKWYMWPMACVTDPRFSEERIELSKPLSLVYIIDDLFDVRGSIDTLTLFTDAVNRWESEATEQLPVHLKICFKVLYDVTNEFAHKFYIKHGWNPINTLQKLWTRLCNAFLLETQWFAFGHLPKAEEYLKNGLTTMGALVALGHAFFLLDYGITKETAMHMDDNPSIISAVATIVRLFDDLEGAMEDNQDGHDGSYLKVLHERVPRNFM